MQFFLDAQITHHAKAVELFSHASKTLRDIELDSDIGLILDRIHLAASRPSSPVNHHSFNEVSQFSRTSASPMKSPLKSANGLYSPGSPTLMKMSGGNANRMYRNENVPSNTSPFGRKSLLKNNKEFTEEPRSRNDSKVPSRRSRSTMR